jgi:hypothetical protein
MCSQWAGIWSGSSITSIEVYSKALSDAHKSIEAINEVDRAHQAWEACFAKLIDGLSSGAINYINTITAPSRERVDTYRSVLWVWQQARPS